MDIDYDSQCLSELRIVLMGYKLAGKSSVGNTILGRKEFDLKRSSQCVRRHGEVADRHIAVIEAPGWWIDVPVEFGSELLKQEIVFSVSLCPPGPHAVLLIIPMDIGFNETERKVLHGYLDLLSERVWSHTIVLFTRGDSLLDTSIEQHIESEGQDLQWLLDKCGNRYHVLNNKNRRDHTQIKELLEKIEETVTQNNCCHLEIDAKILQEVKERRGQEEEMAEERMKRMKKQRENIRSQMMSGDERSDTWSLGSPGYSSFRSRSGDSMFELSRSRDLPHTTYRSEAKKQYNSMEFPLNLSGDERSDTRSLGSSGFGSFRSRSGADSASVFSSSRSIVSSLSSGLGSLRSIPESVEQSETRRALGKLNISKLFPRILKKHDNQEEDSKKT